MAGLLYKELIVNKKSLISMALGEAGISLILIMPLIFKDDFADADILSAILSVFVFFVMFLTIGMLSANIFEADETKKMGLFCYLNAPFRQGSDRLEVPFRTAYLPRAFSVLLLSVGVHGGFRRLGKRPDSL